MEFIFVLCRMSILVDVDGELPVQMSCPCPCTFTCQAGEEVLGGLVMVIVSLSRTFYKCLPVDGKSWKVGRM